MSRRELRIRVDGRVDGDTAASLGAETEQRDDEGELVFEYLDQAHLTGVLVQLADLHVSYSRIEISEVDGQRRGET